MRAGADPSPFRPVPGAFRLFESLFLLSLFIFPVFLGGVELWSFSLGAAVLCGAFGWFWYKCALHEKGFLRSSLDGWIAVYSCFFMAALLFSRIPYLSLVEGFKLAVVLCAFVATRTLCRERQQIIRLAEIYVFLGGFLSLVGLLQFVGGLPKDWWSNPNFLSSTYVNHNHFAGLLVLALPISLGLVLAERNKSKKVLFIFMAVLMGVAFIFTLSRGAWVALAISMVFMMWALKKRQLISSVLPAFLAFVVLVVGAVIMFGTSVIEDRIENIQAMTREEELSLRFRWLTWQGTLPMISRFFWFGSGPGTFGHLFLSFRPEGFSMRPIHAHNDFLQLWAECGVFSYLTMAGMIGAFFRSGWRIVCRDESRLRIGVGCGVLAGMAGFLTHALFDFNFHIPANWLLSAVAAGLLFSLDKDRFYTGKRSSIAIKAAVSLILPVLLAVSAYLGLSGYKLWEAKNLLAVGERGQARKSIEQSLALNPHDAEAHYFRGLIRSREDASASVKDLAEAMRLNSYEPVYDMAKARLLAPHLAESSPEGAVALFKRALEKDRHNEALAFMAARETFGRDGGKFSALRKRAGAMLEKEPAWLSGLVSYLEKSDRWRYHREYYLKWHGIDPEKARGGPVQRQAYSQEQVYPFKDFSTRSGEPLDAAEVLYKNEEISLKIEVHNPMTLLVLECRGSVAGRSYPVLYVRIDGKLVDEYYVNSETYKEFTTVVGLTRGTHRLSIEYVNDLRMGGLSSEDRNVWIRRASLLGP